MSTQLQSLDDAASDEWKSKYSQVLNELEDQEKIWSHEEGELYKSILRLIFTYTGLNENLDQQLSRLRDNLRKEKNNSARHKIIKPVIEEVVSFARKQEPGQAQESSENILSLMTYLELPDANSKQLKTIREKLSEKSAGQSIQSSIIELAELINKAGKTAAPESRHIELESEDPLKQLLENISLPGELGIEVMTLRKRAVEIEEEQDRLALIQDLVRVLGKQNQESTTQNSDTDNFPNLKETLMELFEWLSIPAEYGKRVEHVKNQIAKLEAESDLSVVLRDTAIVINDLQNALQLELGDVQNFLLKVTSRLEDVETCFRDLSSVETENREQTKLIGEDIKSSVTNIREGITDSTDLVEMKQNIESRLAFIEQSVEDYSQLTQQREQIWEGTVSTLKGRIKSMKGETIKLHQRIQEEYKRAKTDALTGVPNRLAYNEKIKQEFARWQRNSIPFSVCVIDVDKFKGVNDTYGHKAGDKVLKTLAEVCAINIREVDFFARYGGEEFVVLLPETELEQAKIVAENLRRQIEVCKFHYAKEPVVITISCGLSEFGQDDTIDSVFNRADKALYSAKENGRNRIAS